MEVVLLRGSIKKLRIKRIISFNIVVCLLLLIFLVMFNQPYGAVRSPEIEPNNSFAQASDNLISNGTYSGDVDQNDMRDYYQIDLDAGQTISLSYKTDPFGNDTALVLYNGNKQEIWNTSWVSFGAEIKANYTINRTVIGPYYLVVMAKDFGNSYNITTEILSQNDGERHKDAGDTISTALEIFGGLTSGFLADEDEKDYYKFTVPASGVFNVNMSVSTKFTTPIKFDVYDDSKTIIKTTPELPAGMYQTYRYTLNNTVNREFYISATIGEGRNEYNITLTVTTQDDGNSGGDASNSLSTAAIIDTLNVDHTGWLGGGKLGEDDADTFKIPLSITEDKMKVNVTITPSSSLDITIYIYDDSFGLLASKDIVKGVKLSYELKISTLPTIYVTLQVDTAKNSDGDYTVKFIVEGISPSDVDDDGDKLPDIWEVEHFGAKENSSATDDPDADGLKNLGEYNVGTDPNNADSDADAMKDGWEVDNSLNPLENDGAKDPDFDGFTNLQEYQNQTDPQDELSKPLAGFDHLTAEAVKRIYVDASADVRYWRGTYDNTSDTQTIAEGKIDDYPEFDLLRLTSVREGEKLVVRLELAGFIYDSGDLDTRADGMDVMKGTFYWVAFVAKSFAEPSMDEESGLELIDPYSEDKLFTLIYVNKTYIGTPGTNLEKVDNGRTLEWRVPLADISTLTKDFAMYGSVTNIHITQTGSINAFETHFDSLGAGSIPMGDSNITFKIENSEVIEGHDVKVIIKTDNPNGQILINKAKKPSAKIPSDTEPLNIYVNIELIGGVKAKDIFISIGYNESIIPKDFSEKDLKIYYYNTSLKGWIKVSNSGVWTNNNTVWARPKHLTIFAPMAHTEKEHGGLGSFWLIIISIIIIVVIIIIIMVVLIIQKRKRARRRPAPGPHRPYRALTPEFFSCPRCGDEIEVLYAETEQVGLECPKCGSKGKIDNPYLRRREAEVPEEREGRPRRKREYEEEGEGYEREYDREHEPEYEREYDREDEEDYAQRDAGRRERPRERAREPEPEVELDYHRPPPSRKRRDREYDKEYKSDEERESGAVLEEEKDYEFKACPKCGKDIAVPYEEEEKIVLRCPYCGAAGKVKNPYI
jgi:DNA-directed RNA polymerase subunit RPC12/RpoP